MITASNLIPRASAGSRQSKQSEILIETLELLGGGP